uniref:Uncharacterized protein n=1 Tax=Triticum urartu TaxID=4572 RepID=A0A8R7P6T4_TRIUA
MGFSNGLFHFSWHEAMACCCNAEFGPNGEQLVCISPKRISIASPLMQKLVEFTMLIKYWQSICS